MVADVRQRSQTPAHPRLLSRRGREGAALLALSRGTLRPRGRRSCAVVVDRGRVCMTAYAELDVRSNFSFLEGGSHAGELVDQAKALGLAAIGIADRNTLAGVVRAHAAAKACGLPL